MKNVTIKMTRNEALKMGLLTCSKCGYPENNHFDFGKKLCARDKECTGYREVARVGKIMKRKPATK